MKIKEQIIKDICKKFPIKGIKGFDSETIKALLFVISQRDVLMLNEAIQAHEKEIQAFLEKKLVQKRKELEELDKIQDFDGAYILKIEIKLLESLEKEIKGEA